MSKGIQTNKFRRFVTVFAVLGSLCTLVAFTYADKFKQQPIKLTIAEGEDDDEPLSSSCGGVERWDVKVMTDTAAYRLVLTPKLTSIFHLVTLTTPAPNSNMPRYNPVEDSVYTIIGTVTEKRDESDSDYHIVISDGSNTIITEIPNPNCSSVSPSPYINDFIAARKWVDSIIGTGTYVSMSLPNVEITGQAFIDPPHSQSGAAPNNLELHSVLKIQFYNLTTGIPALSDGEGIRIYPNPSNGVFNISMPGANNNEEKVEIYNMLGEKIFESRIISNKGQINITGQPEGIYLYKIADENGGYISTGKLIIQ